LVERLSKLSFYNDDVDIQVSNIPLPESDDESDDEESDCESELSEAYLVSDYFEMENLIPSESEALSEHSFDCWGSDTIQFIDASDEENDCPKDEIRQINQPISEAGSSLVLDDSEIIDARSYSSKSGSYRAWSTTSFEDELKNLSLDKESDDFFSTTSSRECLVVTSDDADNSKRFSNLTSSPNLSICSLVGRLDMMTETFEKSVAKIERNKGEEEEILKQLLQKAEIEMENRRLPITPNTTDTSLEEKMQSSNVSFGQLMGELDLIKDTFEQSMNQLLDEEEDLQIKVESGEKKRPSMKDILTAPRQLRCAVETQGEKKRPNMKDRLTAPRQLRCAVEKPVAVDKSM
jgi:hypothetical protein